MINMEDLVETSSTLSIFTFSEMTPAVVATLSTYLSWIALKAVLVIGKDIVMISTSKQEARALFPCVTATPLSHDQNSN